MPYDLQQPQYWDADALVSAAGGAAATEPGAETAWLPHLNPCGLGLI